MLSVDCRAEGHQISPYIYGIAGPVDDIPATASRWGGNPTTRYNWQLDAINVGKDWYFENGKSGNYREFLSLNRSRHVFSALTVPIIGWVAKDTNSVGFPVSSIRPAAKLAIPTAPTPATEYVPTVLRSSPVHRP